MQDLPSMPERFATVASALALALWALHEGSWIQALAHDMYAAVALMIAAYLFFETKAPDRRKRRLALMIIALAGGAALLN